PPYVAGFDRFYEVPAARPVAAKSSDVEEESEEEEDPSSEGPTNTLLDDPVSGGLLLLAELYCLSCHAAEGPTADRILRKPAPYLGEVASRANPEYLRKFIRNPHATKPGTTMPDLLGAVPADEGDATAEAITHYLASLVEKPWHPTG